MDLQVQIEKVDEEIAKSISKQNAHKIQEHYANMSDFGAFNVVKMWKLKKKILPNRNDSPSSKRDSFGNLVSSRKGILALYKSEYIQNLSGKSG